MSTKRHTPDTSRKAYRSQTDSGAITSIKEIIMKTMSRIKYGHQERIAKASGLTNAQVWRRLSELEQEGRLTKTNYAVVSDITLEKQSVYILPELGIRLELKQPK